MCGDCDHMVCVVCVVSSECVLCLSGECVMCVVIVITWFV